MQSDNAPVEVFRLNRTVARAWASWPREILNHSNALLGRTRKYKFKKIIIQRYLFFTVITTTVLLLPYITVLLLLLLYFIFMCYDLKFIWWFFVRKSMSVRVSGRARRSFCSRCIVYKNRMHKRGLTLLETFLTHFFPRGATRRVQGATKRESVALDPSINSVCRISRKPRYVVHRYYLDRSHLCLLQIFQRILNQSRSMVLSLFSDHKIILRLTL